MRFLSVFALLVMSVVSADITSPFLSTETRINQYTLGFEESSDELVVQTTVDWNEDTSVSENDAFYALVHKEGDRRCKVFAGDFDTSEKPAADILAESLQDMLEFLYPAQERCKQQMELTETPAFLRTTFLIQKEEKVTHVCISIYNINQWLVGFVVESDTNRDVAVGDADAMIYNTFLRPKTKT
jgi:hypothetical protein